MPTKTVENSCSSGVVARQPSETVFSPVISSEIETRAGANGEPPLASRRWQGTPAGKEATPALTFDRTGRGGRPRPPAKPRNSLYFAFPLGGEGGTSASEANRVTNEGSGYDKRNVKDNPSSPPTAELPPEGKPYKVWAFLVHPVGGPRANRPTVGYADKNGRK